MIYSSTDIVTYSYYLYNLLQLSGTNDNCAYCLKKQDNRNILVQFVVVIRCNSSIQIVWNLKSC